MNTLSHSKQTNQILSLSTAPTISHTQKMLQRAVHRTTALGVMTEQVYTTGVVNYDL